MRIEAVTTAVERITDSIDMDDFAAAKADTLLRLRASCEAMVAAIDAERDFRSVAQARQVVRQRLAWTLPSFKSPGLTVIQ